MEQTPGVSAGPRTPRLTQGLPHRCKSPLNRKKRQWTTPRGPRTPGEGNARGASWRKSRTRLKSRRGKDGAHTRKRELKQLSVEGDKAERLHRGPEEGGATCRDIPDRLRRVGTGQRPLEHHEEAWKGGDAV